jgi:N-acyl amino acid synthase of PEP-CTERM/exosortase system
MSATIRNVLSRPVEINRLTGNDSLLAQHDRHFSTVRADSPALLRVAHALRFQVYCLERKFENAEDHPDGLEIDAYDDHAIQGVMFHRPTQSAMGAVRMIHSRGGIPDSLPIEGLLRPSSLDISDYVDVSQTIEISRFAISKEFRRRKSDEIGASALTHTDAAEETHLAFLGLSQFVLREALKRNVLFWTAVMEPKLLRLLARMGICYTPIGPLVEHHGIRQPCYCYVPDMLENARRAHPQWWSVLTDGGLLHDQLTGTIRELAVA